MAASPSIASDAEDPHHLTIPSTNIASGYRGHDSFSAYSHSSQQTAVSSGHGHACEELPGGARKHPEPCQCSANPDDAYDYLAISCPLDGGKNFTVERPDSGPRITQAQSKEQPYVEACGVKFQETFVSNVMLDRYEKLPTRKTNSENLHLEAGFDNFPSSALPSHWNRCIHPEGVEYLFYQEGEKGIFTNVDSTFDLSKLVKFGTDLYNMLPAESAPKIELYLGVTQNCYNYYFVDHERRLTFWLHKVDIKHLCSEMRGIRSLKDIKYLMEQHYWQHCETFPHNRFIPKVVVKELRDMVLYANADTLTSDTSTSVFDNEELSKIMNLLDAITVGTQDTVSACIISRFMAQFSEAKFLNFYGGKNARISSNQTIFVSNETERGRVMEIVSWLLFRAPEVHAHEFREAWVDRLVHKMTWKKFMAELTEEWQEFTLFATVLLNANVAFLAVPGVINSSDSDSTQSAAQITSYMSVITSLGSIVLGLLLVRQNKTARRDKVGPATTFLLRVTNSFMGVESIPYIYSLPYALLMWSMVCFIVAVAFLVFGGTTAVTRILSGVASGIVAAFVTWSVVTGWNSSKSRA